MKSLLLDDIRDIKADKICRNYNCACMAVKQYEFDTLYLDHDLGEYHTGYDFMRYCIQQGIKFKEIVIVSSNPVGRENIGFVLANSGYVKVTPFKYRRIV